MFQMLCITQNLSQIIDDFVLSHLFSLQHCLCFFLLLIFWLQKIPTTKENSLKSTALTRRHINTSPHGRRLTRTDGQRSHFFGGLNFLAENLQVRHLTLGEKVACAAVSLHLYMLLYIQAQCYSPLRLRALISGMEFFRPSRLLKAERNSRHGKINSLL